MMRILAVDDEKFALTALEAAIRGAAPEAEVDCFDSSRKALSAAGSRKYDVLFTDIRMPELQGHELAAEIKKLYPQINIIFVTGFDNYKDSAISIHASGYVNKPVLADDIRAQLDNLLYPVSEKGPEVYARTFGYFDLLIDGKPLKFTSSRGKELLAYLIDRQGSDMTKKQLAAIMFEDKDYSRTEQSYLQRILKQLEGDLIRAGVPDMLVKSYGSCRVDVNTFKCDAYDFLKGDPEARKLFHDEYLEQYSWAELTKGIFYEDEY